MYFFSHLALGLRIGVVAGEFLLVTFESCFRNFVEGGVVNSSASWNSTSLLFVRPVVGVSIELIIWVADAINIQSITSGTTARVPLGSTAGVALEVWFLYKECIFLYGIILK